MRLSLQTRVSVFITLIIVAVSLVSTYLFVAVHLHSEEEGLIARGAALSYALSKAAEEGLIDEDLNLIRKASHIIKAPDVTLAQVYSDIWEAIDAFPVEGMKEPPDPSAVRHFADSQAPFSVKTGSGYDFYYPILFRPSQDSAPVSIGFVRLSLSSAAIRRGTEQVVIANVAVSALITVFAILAINIIIRRLVTKPVMALYGSVSAFKNGMIPDKIPLGSDALDEIGELSAEFGRMCRAIREKEERLVESDRRMRSLFERVEHGIFRLDRDGRIVEANGRFREMFGEVGALCDIFIGDRSASDCLGQAISGRGFHIDDTAVSKNGDEMSISLSLYPEADSRGETVGFDGYILDVSEKKRIEERLIRSQKMEAVGTLAGGMAHDFNNLLTAILGYAEIILSMTQEGDQFNKPATIIYEAAKRGADFGKKILTITRKEKLETKLVNINEIVRQSVELLQRSIPKNIEISVNLDEHLPQTKADPSQMQQVVINLAVNARDAMPDGGRLTIGTSAVGAEDGAANNIGTPNGGFVKLSISDTGVGIDTVTQRKIFDPFFTTKEIGKGTGLGLYIVHSIVNNHGGYINLYSEPMKGTRFNIYLPVTGGKDAEEYSDMVRIGGTGTILVIDDESDVRELCRDMLEPLGYTVLAADSGSAGINLFREMRGEISVVILDMIMPKTGGSEVFQALRTIDPDVKVLLCSGYSQSGFAGIDEVLKSGAVGFIQKPFSRQAIAFAVKKAVSI
jgi:signal transduction histidine kinase/CheY-like chemotaxis protein/HAMP domain-containing protein